MTQDQFEKHQLDTDKAFQKAIKEGRLSNDMPHKNWAGKYMYMYTDRNGKDQFKDRITPEYLP